MSVSGDDILPIIPRHSLAAFRERITIFNASHGTAKNGTGYEMEIRYHDSVISYLSKEGISEGGVATFARVP